MLGSVSSDTSPKRPRGRPRLDPDDPNPSAALNLRVSAKQYDEVFRQARVARLEVPEYLRRLLPQPKD